MIVTSPTPLPEELSHAMKTSGVWQQSCPVPLERLSLVTIRYHDFSGNRHDDGELIVFDAAAHCAAKIFQRLFELEFPIARLRSIHHYGGNDDASMADNNSSSFNFRSIPDGKTVSIHGYGLAIDINPVQNPFLQFDNDNALATIHPPEGWQYLNRHNQKPGMVEPIVSIFEENGFFVWGGRWTTPIDYHHFQPPQVVVTLMSGMNLEDGKNFFDLCIEHRASIMERQPRIDTADLIATYNRDREQFFKSFLEAITEGYS